MEAGAGAGAGTSVGAGGGTAEGSTGVGGGASSSQAGKARQQAAAAGRGSGAEQAASGASPGGKGPGDKGPGGKPAAAGVGPGIKTVRSDGSPRTEQDEELWRCFMADDVGGTQAALAAGADPNSCCLDPARGRMHPLVCAAAYKSPATVRALLRGGADPNAQLSGMTALMAATQRNCAAEREEVLGALLEAGADPLVAGRKGLTAIDGAPDSLVLRQATEQAKEAQVSGGGGEGAGGGRGGECWGRCLRYGRIRWRLGGTGLPRSMLRLTRRRCGGRRSRRRWHR